MKKVLTIFFTTLGVVFFALILFGLYFYIADLLELKSLFYGVETEQREDIVESSVSESVDSHPTLNESQEAALETVGIDPATLPSSITPEQEACFVEAIGQARVDEIKAGGSPTASEVFSARGCI